MSAASYWKMRRCHGEGGRLNWLEFRLATIAQDEPDLFLSLPGLCQIMTIDRRDFLSAGAAAAAGLTMSGFALPASAAGTSNLRCAAIGVHAQGNSHVIGMGKRVVAICDVDQKVLAERTKEHEERIGQSIDTFTDYRRLLERDDIDAISIGTPNHTHALIAIAAIQAGKHVYVEKPVSHNVWEGRQLVAAARKYNRIVQCGTQSRSSVALKEAVAWVQDGGLGKIQHALGTCYKPRKSIGKLSAPLSISDSIDYDLWCGPAEKRDLYRSQLHYDWHWDFNTGCGDTGNQGIHQMDIARWFMGEKTLAPRTLSIGGRLGYKDAADTPNTQVVYHDYAAAPLIFETRGLPRSKQSQANWGHTMDRYRGSGIGVIIQCEEGHVYVVNYGEAYAYDRKGEQLKHWKNTGDLYSNQNHINNWLDAIVAGDRSLLNAEIQEGHLSSSLCHVGNVSHRLGKKVVAGDIADQVAANPLLSGSYERMVGHLRANDIDVDSPEQALTLGTWIEVDTKTEQFVGNDAASKLRTRRYRAPFIVPDLGA